MAEPSAPYGAGAVTPPISSPRQKLVLFTEYRDTLNYLERQIASLLGRSQAVVMIHGGMGRQERRKAQESLLHDPEVQVLLATELPYYVDSLGRWKEDGDIEFRPFWPISQRNSGNAG